MSDKGFVGRQASLALVDAALRAAEGGDPQLVLVSGEAGIGKTRMVEFVAGRFEQLGGIALRTRCVELGEHGVPLAAPTMALRELVARFGTEWLTSVCPGADPLFGLLPEMDDRPSLAAQPGMLFDLFGALLRQVAVTYPTLWLIDDVERADRSTRDMLNFLVRTARAARLVVIGAYRSDPLPANHPVRSLAADLARLDNVSAIELSRMSRAETIELLSNVAGVRLDTGTAEAIYRRSGGNPLYAIELARAPDGQLWSGSLRALLQAHLDRLTPLARHVVRRAAVAGPVVPHDLLLAVADLPQTHLLRAVRAATTAGVLVARGPDYAFQHELLREAVLADMLPAELAELHRICAQTLTVHPALAMPEQVEAAVGRHWHHAGEPARAVPHLLRAAEQAKRVHAYAEQALLLNLVLEHTSLPALKTPQPTAVGDRSTDDEPGQDPELDVLGLVEAAVAAATWAGEYTTALDLCNRGLRLVDPQIDPTRAALLSAHQAMALQHLHQAGATAAIDRAVRLAEVAPGVQGAQVLAYLASALILSGQARRARELAERAVALAYADVDGEVHTQTRATLSWVLIELGAYEPALHILDPLKDDLTTSTDSAHYARVWLNVAAALYGLGRFRDAEDAARTGLRSAGAVGMERGLGAALREVLARALFAVGDWEAADETCRDALAADPSGPPAVALHVFRAQLALARGDLVAARSALTEAEVLRSDSPTVWAARLHGGQAELACRENRFTDAAVAIEHGLAVAEASPLDVWELLVTAARVERRARAATGLGTRDAPQRWDRLRQVGQRLPRDTPLLAAYARQSAAELNDPEVTWADVADAWHDLGYPLMHAEASLRAAQVAVAHRDRDEAGTWLSRARDTAVDLGAHDLLAEVHLFADTSHLCMPQTPDSQLADRLNSSPALTARELEVLRLVTTGRSNRQIAAELYVSPKTVSAHVSHILDKLGVASRGEAAAAAHRLHLVQDGPSSPSSIAVVESGR